MRVDGSFYTVPGMRVDGKVLAVNGKSNFDGTFTAVTQHDGKFLAVDGNSNFDGKSPLYRDRPPVRYFYVGKFTEHLPAIFAPRSKTKSISTTHTATK